VVEAAGSPAKSLHVDLMAVAVSQAHPDLAEHSPSV
jgi:hypothetical protein